MRTIANIIGICLILTAACSFMWMSGAYAGIHYGIEKTQKEAIEKGAARWVCDPTTGAKTLEWNGTK